MIRQPTVSVVALVVEKGRVLISERLSGKCQGKYQAPGGHLEWMETFVDGALRELREETGLLADPSACSVVGVDQGFAPEEDHCWVVIFVLVSRYTGRPVRTELEKQGPWEWYDLGCLPPNTLLPLKRICLKLKNRGV